MHYPLRLPSRARQAAPLLALLATLLGALALPAAPPAPTPPAPAPAPAPAPTAPPASDPAIPLKQLTVKFPNGRLQHVWQCLVNADGQRVPHGWDVTFYPCRDGDPNPSLKIRKVTYDHGVLTGDYIRFGTAMVDVDQGTDPIAKGRHQLIQLRGNLREGRREGVFRFYNNDGQLKATINYLGGLMDGLATVYAPTGQKVQELDFIAGKKDGHEKHYDLAGHLVQDTPWRKDQKQGTETLYEADGARLCTTVYVDGAKSGPEVLYYPGGKAKQLEIMYQNNVKDGLTTEYFPNGQPHLQVTFAKGTINGRLTTFDETGKTLSTATYKDGEPWDGVVRENTGEPGNYFIYTFKGGQPVDGQLFDALGPKDGVVQTWYGRGLPMRLSPYRNGKLNGKEVVWYKTGQKQCEATWKDNRLEGTYTEWYTDGQPRWEVNLSKGQKDGEESMWSERGQRVAYGINKEGQPWNGLLPFNVQEKDGSLTTVMHNFRDGVEVALDTPHPELSKFPNLKDPLRDPKPLPGLTLPSARHPSGGALPATTVAPRPAAAPVALDEWTDAAPLDAPPAPGTAAPTEDPAPPPLR